MTYQWLADAVLVIHLLFIVFVVLGGFLALRWRWLVWLHAPAALWGAVIEFGGWVCPLTPLEQSLRRAGGGSGYSGGFIEYYLTPFIYPAGLSRAAQILLGASVLLINAAAYSLFARARRAKRG